MPEEKDPEVKADPKPVTNDAKSRSELAEALGGTVSDEVTPTKPEAAPKEKVTPTSQEKPEAKEGETEAGEQEGDRPPLDIDPNKPEDAIKALLGHPVLGKELQRWSDGAVAAQVVAARRRDRPAIEASERQKAKEQADDEHFASMSQEDVAEEISRDPKSATAYAQYQARQQQGAGLDPDGVAAASTVYAFTAQVALNNQLLEGSDLPADKKAELAGKNFMQHGSDGILMWGEAVQTALIEQKAEVRAQQLLDEKWEAHKEEKLVELDGDRPPVVRGDRKTPVQDLLAEDSATQMEKALASDK